MIRQKLEIFSSDDSFYWTSSSASCVKEAVMFRDTIKFIAYSYNALYSVTWVLT